MSDSESILQEAERLINGDRQQDYGNVTECHESIARLWSAYLDTELDAFDIVKMMILLKVARSRDSYKRDSYVDIAGYAGLAEKLHDEASDDVSLYPEGYFTINGVHEALQEIWRQRGPIEPRVWESLVDVPLSVSVTDRDGDIWEFENDQWGFHPRENRTAFNRCDTPRRPTGWDSFAPFTEVLEGTT